MRIIGILLIFEQRPNNTPPEEFENAALFYGKTYRAH